MLLLSDSNSEILYLSRTNAPHHRKNSALAHRDVNKEDGCVSYKTSVSGLVDSAAANDFSKDFDSIREILDGEGITDQRLPASAAKALKGTDIQEMREKRSSIFKVFYSPSACINRKFSGLVEIFFKLSF